MFAGGGPRRSTRRRRRRRWGGDLPADPAALLTPAGDGSDGDVGGGLGGWIGWFVDGFPPPLDDDADEREEVVEEEEEGILFMLRVFSTSEREYLLFFCDWEVGRTYLFGGTYCTHITYVADIILVARRTN